MPSTWLGAGIVGWLVYLAQTDVEGDSEMTDLRKAAEMALEALEHWMRIDTVEDMHIFETVTAPEAIAVLRKALEQEPWDTTDMAHRAGGLSMEQEHESRITSLEVRVAKLENPMTEHEKQLMAGQRSLLRTAPPKQPDQEPVAFVCRGKFSTIEHCEECKPLYAAPPKRKWVGLTDEEEIELDETYGDDFNAYIDARDTKLKEKNT